jgi:sulfur-carrier protein
MKVRVLYFAQVAQKLGVSQEEIKIDDKATSEDLMKVLNENHPVLQTLTFKLAVNQVLTQANVVLTDNCEIALLPPFAGG